MAGHVLVYSQRSLPCIHVKSEMLEHPLLVLFLARIINNGTLWSTGIIFFLVPVEKIFSEIRHYFTVSSLR